MSAVSVSVCIKTDSYNFIGTYSLLRECGRSFLNLNFTRFTRLQNLYRLSKLLIMPFLFLQKLSYNPSSLMMAGADVCTVVY
jgi:hypothetical protein